MTLRRNLSPAKQEAHQVLDLVRANVPVANWRIRKALVILGDVA
jgi:hypothetical protein